MWFFLSLPLFDDACCGSKKREESSERGVLRLIQIPCILCSIALIRLLDLGRTFRCLSSIIDDARLRELGRNIQKASSSCWTPPQFTRLGGRFIGVERWALDVERWPSPVAAGLHPFCNFLIALKLVRGPVCSMFLAL